jgi:Ca2+-binding RTX toxin-like protein
MSRRLLIPALAVLAILVVAGTAFAATQHCDGECSGTGMADKLVGSPGVDIIHALAGNDEVFGREDDDWLKGGPGNDEVHGQQGNDRVKGHLGRDLVFGGPGDVLVRGGTAHQTDDGVPDDLYCGGGTDTVHYTPGTDTISDCEIEVPSSP